MTDPKPIAVMDAQDPAQETPARQHRLDWLRAEGIDPDKTLRVEVFGEGDSLYAILRSTTRQDGHVIEERIVSGERPDYTIRRAVSSLPPAEAAAQDLAARVGQSGQHRMSNLTDPAQRREFARLTMLDEATHISRDQLRDHVHSQHPDLEEGEVTAIVNDLDHLIRSATVTIAWPHEIAPGEVIVGGVRYPVPPSAAASADQ